MLRHILNDTLDSNIDGVLDDALIQVTDHVLDDTELLEKFTSGIQDFVGEDILFAIDPEVWETLLS